MSLSIDFRTLPISIPSLCIPRVFSNIDEKRIRHIFDELNMGIIERVDIINKTTEKGEKFNRVFVHFKRWFSNSNADTARERLLNGKEIKIIYDDPWFWKVSAYRPPQEQQRASHDSRPQKKRPTLQFDDSDNERDEFGCDRRQQRERPSEKRPVPEKRERPIQEKREKPVQRPIQEKRERPIQEKRERPVQRPIQEKKEKPAKRDQPVEERPIVPRSTSSSPPPIKKEENKYSNPQVVPPVVYRRLTMKPSQVKEVKKPQPLVLEEGEIVEN